MGKISRKEKEKLYTKIKHQLGYPLRNFELRDEQMDSLLDISIEDYSSYVNNWLIEQQWHTLQGVDVTTEELTYAYTTKTMNFERSFLAAYSKQVGLGTNAPSQWELKRDFITISSDTQVYVIPAGREVNEVLWYTPPLIDRGILDPFAVTNWGAGSYGWSYLGRPAQYIQPTYSLLLSSQDRAIKRRIIQSELTYRITAGPNGTKLLYLYPVPGGRYEIWGKYGKHLAGSKVWYFYYDLGKKRRSSCLNQNDDVIRLPSDAPIDKLSWTDLNSVAQNRVRKMFLAEVKMAIAKVRGFFSGEIKAGEASLTMDYRMLMEEGTKEKDDVLTETKDSLEKLTLKQLMEDRASIAENLNRVMGYVPMTSPIMEI